MMVDFRRHPSPSAVGMRAKMMEQQQPAGRGKRERRRHTQQQQQQQQNVGTDGRTDKTMDLEEGADGRGGNGTDGRGRAKSCDGDGHEDVLLLFMLPCSEGCV
uniref:Uncharacterized protein n=1 Tax=Globodera rostochiensis TaxID=31243 RepID=A0A914HBU6_GLORO